MTVDEKARVLVMEEEDIVRDVTIRILESRGYSVGYASEGGEALKRYQEARENGLPYDVVILDLGVAKGIGGLETMERLREIDPGVRAVISTGGGIQNIDELEKRGFKGALNKPYGPDGLTREIEKVLRE